MKRDKSYLYDLVGNITQRQESTQGLTENFCYDNIYRLIDVKLGGSDCVSAPIHIAYDNMGNVTSKMALAPIRATPMDLHHRRNRHRRHEACRPMRTL